MAHGRRVANRVQHSKGVREMFFNGWLGIGRVALFTTLGYVALVVLLRVGGKRTLANMDEFDLAVTVAVGSTLANLALSRDVAWLEGATALAVLIALQVVVTFAASRSRKLFRIIENEPTLLLFRGQMLRDAVKAVRSTEDEVLHAIRAAGIGATEDVEAVVLETNGSYSVIRRGSPSLSALGTMPHDAGVD